MKKILLFLIGFFFISVQTFADTRAQALLLHNGQGKSFEADQLQTAINEAVAGDTITLSEGAFLVTGDTLVIDKDVCIIGAGADVCKIGGNVKVAIDDDITLKRHLLDALKVAGSINVTKSIRSLSIRKCWVSNFFQVINGAEARDVRIDRCYIFRFSLKSPIKSATLTNSILHWQGYNVGGDTFVEGYDINFINCNIYLFDAYCDLAATYQTCIIYGPNNAHAIKNNTFINTLFSTNGYAQLTSFERASNGNVVHNCYWHKFTVSVKSNNDNFPEFGITTADLQANNYLGTDGTIVGAYGGYTPYSLEPEGISIKESILRVDPETRKLNVTLKVATE